MSNAYLSPRRILKYLIACLLFLANLSIWALIAIVSTACYFALTTAPLDIARYYANKYLIDHNLDTINGNIQALSYNNTSINQIHLQTTQQSHINAVSADYSIDGIQQHKIDHLTITGAELHCTIEEGEISFGTLSEQLRTLSKESANKPKNDKPWQIHHIRVKDSVMYIHGLDQTTTLPFNLTLEPYQSGFKGHLNIPSARLVLASYPLGEIGQLDIESNMKGDVDFIITDEGSEILASSFKATAPGSVKFTASESIQKGYANQPQMQMLLQALSNYQFKAADIALSSDKNHQVTASLKLKGTNPQLSGGRDVNINVNLTGNVFDLLSNTPYDVPPVVKSFIDSIGANQ